MRFFVKGPQNCQTLKLKLPKKSISILTPFEVNLHTVLQLKALSSGIEAFRSHGSGRPFIITTTILKVPVLYHTEANSQFVLLLIVNQFDS